MTIPLLGVDANENWNQFRGPNGSGNANENFTPPIHISNDNIAWKTNIPEGLSSPVIYENRIFLTAIENNRLLTLCINASNGSIEWKSNAPECDIEKVHKTNAIFFSTRCFNSSIQAFQSC